MPDNFYKGELGQAFAGMLVNMEPKVVISRANEDEAVLPFGRAVFQGETDKGCTVTPAADQFVGISILDRSAYLSDDMETEGFRHGDEVRVLRKGVVWVVAAGAVAPRDPVYVSAAGAFGNAAGSGGVRVTGASFDTTTTAAGQLAQLRID